MVKVEGVMRYQWARYVHVRFQRAVWAHPVQGKCEMPAFSLSRGIIAIFLYATLRWIVGEGGPVGVPLQELNSVEAVKSRKRSDLRWEPKAWGVHKM